MSRTIVNALRGIAVLAICTVGSISLGAEAGNLQRLTVNGAELEYEVRGEGEPVLLIHGTGVAATFSTLMDEPALKGYRLIRYHRRGFAGSSRTPIPFSMQDHAADARGVLAALGLDKAHIVGHSFGASVAMQLALDAPQLVHSLVVMEPPIFNAAAPPAAFAELTDRYRAGDKEGAMETFSQMSYGAQWRTLAARVPGGAGQVIADVDTVYTTEVPAMVNWGLDADKARSITQAIVYVTGGGAHGASFAQLEQWMPGITRVVVPGVTHAMLMQDGKAVAEAIGTFLHQHSF